MRTRLFLSLASLTLVAGCATGDRPQQPDQAKKDETELVQLADRAGEGGTATQAPDVPAAEANGFNAAYPVQTHRARRFYLQGVRLLYEPPNVDDAIREFKLALHMDPRFYKAHFKLGICYYHKGQYELEITEYKLCLAINPNYAPAWLNLGHAYLARDELELARGAYREVLDLNADNRVALYNLGLVEFDLRLYDEAERHLERFLEIDGSGEMGEKTRQYLDEIRRRRGEGVQ